MSRRVAGFRWEQTPLGALERWPTNLRVTTGIVLNSRLPMMLWWGEEHIQIYNDACAEILGSLRHPSGLGQRAQDCWHDTWGIIGPQIELVSAGRGSTFREDRPVAITRGGRTRRAYLSYGLSPVDGDGRIDGVLAVSTDVTQQHFDVQRSRILSAGLLRLFEAGPDFVAVLRGPDHVYQFVNNHYKALLGDRDFIGKSVREVVPEVTNQGFIELLDNVYRTGETFISDSIPMQYRQVPDGSLVEVRLKLSYQAIVDPNGDTFGVFVEGHPVDKMPCPKAAELRMEAELTAREAEVLRWTAAGKTAAEIALILGISYRTVEFHITSAARKLDTVNRVHTVVEAIKKKLIPL